MALFLVYIDVLFSTIRMWDKCRIHRYLENLSRSRTNSSGLRSNFSRAVGKSSSKVRVNLSFSEGRLNPSSQGIWERYGFSPSSRSRMDAVTSYQRSGDGAQTRNQALTVLVTNPCRRLVLLNPRCKAVLKGFQNTYRNAIKTFLIKRMICAEDPSIVYIVEPRTANG